MQAQDDLKAAGWLKLESGWILPSSSMRHPVSLETALKIQKLINDWRNESEGMNNV